jgi:cell division GTPase FtsZ
MPFSFEMSKRSQNALEGVRQIQPHAHTLITVPNDRLLQVVPRDLSLEIAFRIADDVLRQGVQGIAELVTFRPCARDYDQRGRRLYGHRTGQRRGKSARGD